MFPTISSGSDLSNFINKVGVAVNDVTKITEKISSELTGQQGTANASSPDPGSLSLLPLINLLKGGTSLSSNNNVDLDNYQAPPPSISSPQDQSSDILGTIFKGIGDAFNNVKNLGHDIDSLGRDIDTGAKDLEKGAGDLFANVGKGVSDLFSGKFSNLGDDFKKGVDDIGADLKTGSTDFAKFIESPELADFARAANVVFAGTMAVTGVVCLATGVGAPAAMVALGLAGASGLIMEFPPVTQKLEAGLQAMMEPILGDDASKLAPLATQGMISGLMVTIAVTGGSAGSAQGALDATVHTFNSLQNGLNGIAQAQQTASPYMQMLGMQSDPQAISNMAGVFGTMGAIMPDISSYAGNMGQPLKEVLTKPNMSSLSKFVDTAKDVPPSVKNFLNGSQEDTIPQSGSGFFKSTGSLLGYAEQLMPSLKNGLQEITSKQPAGISLQNLAQENSQPTSSSGPAQPLASASPNTSSAPQFFSGQIIRLNVKDSNGNPVDVGNLLTQALEVFGPAYKSEISKTQDEQKQITNLKKKLDALKQLDNVLSKQSDGLAGKDGIGKVSIDVPIERFKTDGKGNKVIGPDGNPETYTIETPPPPSNDDWANASGWANKTYNQAGDAAKDYFGIDYTKESGTNADSTNRANNTQKLSNERSMVSTEISKRSSEFDYDMNQATTLMSTFNKMLTGLFDLLKQIHIG